MRRSIVPLALVLALATGAALGQARGLLTPVAVSDDAGLAARVEVVRRFYAAVNGALASGEVRDLDRVVAPDFVDHGDGSRNDSSRDDLLRYLASLRAAFPAVRLTPLDAIAQHDRVVARVEIDGAPEGIFLGIPLGADGIWGGIDIFRVEGDRVVERWSDRRDHRLLEPLAAVPIAVDGRTEQVVRLQRRTYAGGASSTETAVAGPAMLFVESGTPSFALDYRSPKPAVMFRSAAAGDPGGRIAVPPGETVTLSGGDALAVSPRTPYTVRNEERTPATILVVSIGVPPSPETAPEARTTAPAVGVTDDVLAAGNAVTLPPGPLTLALGRATLAPRSELSLHPVAGAEAVAVDGGHLTLVLPRGSAWLHTPEHSAITAREYEEIPTGQGVTTAPGSTVAYRNDGSTALVLLVVTVQPAP
jgi:predicted ester cyclase